MKKLDIWIRHCCIGFMTGILLLCAADAIAADQQSGFPKEPLMERLRGIERLKKVFIAFEGEMVKDLTVQPLAVEGKSADELIALSLRSTALSYVKVNDNRYAIVRKKADEQPAAAPQQTAAKGKGKLSGTVVDKNGFPVPGATVIVMGTTIGTSTDVKGRYTLELAAKTVGVEISCVSYQKMNISDVRLTAGKTTPLDVVLQDASEQLEDVVVTATYNKASANGLYAKLKAMTAMSDGLSADLIKKTSDNNVAQVLKRVAGVTVDNGKYVTVRGMGERYNNVQLNGSTLPSTEPNRRNFSFDIIPTALIDNVTIAKTFTPDMPGEFTGGLVQVNTLSVPEKPLASVSIGTGFNTISTGKEFKSNTRYKGDYLFGNSREWYGTLWNPDTYYDILKNYGTDGVSGDYSVLSDEGKKLMGEMNARIPNRWGLKKSKAAPTQNYAATVGLPFDLGNDNKLGVIASLTYRHEENTDDLLEALYYSGEDSLYAGKVYKFVTSTGAVANIGWERPGHKIAWKNLFNNRFTHSNLERISYDANYRNKHYMEQYSKPLINRLWQTQLEGEHQLPLDMVFTWAGDFSKMNRTAPDERLAKGYIQSDFPFTSDNYLVEWGNAASAQNVQDGHIYYSGLEEKKTNVSANLEYPFIVAGNKQKLKAGYYGSFRRADFKQLYLTILNNQPFEQGLALNDRFSQERFASGELRYAVGGMNGNRDYYNGKQDIHAAYLMGEFTFWKKLHLTAGVRMEKGTMNVFTSTEKTLPGKKIPVDSTIVRKKTDWLPAVTAIYNITDNLNVRAAYSKTLARPDFRELSVGRYYNVDDRTFVRSLGALQQSYSQNIDLRLEWYPQAGEVVSVSGFYKKFDSPVEMIGQMRPGSVTEYELYAVNLEESTVMGLEFNLRKSFGFIAPGSFLKDLYLTANASVIKGNVKYNPYDESNKIIWGDDYVPADNSFDRDRPLLGLAPYLVNVGLMYQGKVLGANINYGRNGRKLTMAGLYEHYDEYENPRDVLDLQVSARFLKEKLEVKFNVSDLLNQPFIKYRNCGRDFGNEQDKGTHTDRTSLGMDYNKGDWVLNKYKRGVTFSLSASYKF